MSDFDLLHCISFGHFFSLEYFSLEFYVLKGKSWLVRERRKILGKICENSEFYVCNFSKTPVKIFVCFGHLTIRDNKIPDPFE